MRGKKGEEWGNDKKIKFVRIRMTSCREATAAAPPLLTITLAQSPLQLSERNHAAPRRAAPRLYALFAHQKYPVRYEITPSVRSPPLPSLAPPLLTAA